MKIICQTGDAVDVSLDRMDKGDLTKLPLHRAILTKGCFNGFHFNDSDLRGALLDQADLGATSFRKSKAMNALFIGSNLRGANFEEASLVGAVFDGADLRDSVFSGADVAFASFVGCDLRGAKLDFHRQQQTDFTGAVFDAGKGHKA